MSGSPQFAVLQKDAAGATPEQLKSAFRTFSNLTDADAVRLAIGAQGILLRQANRDAARAFQKALQAEGVAAAVIPEAELPKLPEARVLHRLELAPEAMISYDLLSRPTSIPWSDLALIAAGAVPYSEAARTPTTRMESRFNEVMGGRSKKITESGPSAPADSQLLLEILLINRTTRFQMEAARFRFNHVVKRTWLPLPEKFIWLVRELCSHAPEALLNGGARWLRAGHQPVPSYVNRQALTDEMIWLLWQARQAGRLVPA